jgi:hypothetical protein
LLIATQAEFKAKPGKKKWQQLKPMQRQREKKQDWPSKWKQTKAKAEVASLISAEAKAKIKTGEEALEAAKAEA